jgi:type I restriction enzyme S subunit
MKTFTLKDLIKNNGIFVDGDWIESKDQDQNGDVRLIQLADIGDGFFVDKSKRYLTSQKAKALKCTFLKKGDLLLARMPDPLGRACIFPGLEMPCVTVVDVCIIRPNSTIINSEYLKYLINSTGFRDKINKYITGTTRQRISRGNLSKIDFKILSFEYQKRIVKILDKADALCQKRKQVIKLLDDYLKSVFLEMFGDPVKNPNAWSVEKLEKITYKIGSGATPKGGKTAYVNKGVSLIRSLNVHDNKFLYKNLAFLNDQQAKALSNVEVNECDVLLNITGASVCRCAIVPNDILPARVNQHVSIIRVKKMLKPKFLLHLLISESYKRKLLKVANFGGATREALTKQQLEELKIICPPIELQKRFALIVEKTESIKQTMLAQLTELETQFQALMQKAFKGEL